MLRKYQPNRYVYYGLPPSEETFFYEYGKREPKGYVVVNDLYDYLPALYEYSPKPNYVLDDQIINQIAFRILTNIFIHKPKKIVEISPITKVRFNLG